MDRNKYQANEDIKLIRELQGATQIEYADGLGVSPITLSRWENRENRISSENLERIYSDAYAKGIPLNSIKEQFYLEKESRFEKILFHGAKTAIEGEISLGYSDRLNDFGTGFYMGESFRQAALFISLYPKASVYVAKFDVKGLRKVEHNVDREWLMTIAVHRDRFKGMMDKADLVRIKKKVSNADYVIAPIADNRMFQIIDTFIEGEITDEQCIHALAATNLGKQYVAVSEKACSRIELLERCYLCSLEKSDYAQKRREEVAAMENKIRAARIKYRGQGKYIDEIL